MISPTSQASLERLRDGERLRADEFFRRYEAMPDCKKAELLNGIVYIGPPVKATHGRSDSRLCYWMGMYIQDFKLIEGGLNCTILLGDDAVPQPDGVMFYRNGTSHLNQDGFITGPPEFVYEVAYSFSDRDIEPRCEVYERYGIQECLIWGLEERSFRWLSLHDGRYVELPMDQNGIIRSEVFPGLWLDAQAMLSGDGKRIIASTEPGRSSPEYLAMIERLSQKSNGGR
jgi:Uma2 family endonuclease